MRRCPVAELYTVVRRAPCSCPLVLVFGTWLAKHAADCVNHVEELDNVDHAVASCG